MANRLLLAGLVACALGLPGCGSGDDDDGAGYGYGGGGTTTVAETPTQTSIDQGCTRGNPRFLRSNGYFRACGSDDGTSILVIDPSSTSLRVTAADPDDPPDMTAEPFSSTASFKEAAIHEAVSGQCEETSSGPCILPPGGRLLAEGTAPVGVRVDVDPDSTAVATATSAAAGYVESKLKTGAQRHLDSVVACGKSVQQLATRDAYIEDTIRHAFGFGSCLSLAREVEAELRAPPPVAATEAATALKAAGRYTKNLRQDFYVYEAIKIAARVHG